MEEPGRLHTVHGVVKSQTRLSTQHIQLKPLFPFDVMRSLSFPNNQFVRVRGEWRGDAGTERALQEGKAAPKKNADFIVCPYAIKVTINGKLQRSLNGNKCAISIPPIPVSLGLCLYRSEGPRAIIPKYTCPPRIKRDWEESCVTQKQKDTLSRAETQTRRKRW